MKKVFSLVVMLIMTLSLLVGCGTKEDQEGQKPGSNIDQEQINDEDNTLIVGTEAGFAPYEYMVGNEVVGIDMDISQAIADYLGKELVIKNMDFDGALLAVQSGKVDFVAAGVSVDEERKEVMDFSVDYVDSTEVVVINIENPMVADIDDLDGKIIGVQQGNIADFYVEENIKAKEIKRYTKFVQGAEDLKNGKIDCLVMDQYPAEELVAANPQLGILDGILFEDKYAIAVEKGNTQLLDVINTVIEQLKNDGKIEEFIENHTQK